MNKIRIRSRLNRGRRLSLAEIDALVATCQLPTNNLTNHITQKRSVHDKTPSNRVSAPKERLRLISSTRGQPDHPVTLTVTNARTRLNSIPQYVDWLVRDHLTLSLDRDVRQQLEPQRILTLDAIRARTPEITNPFPLGGREGLSPDVVDRLLEVTRPDSADNPWLAPHTKVRNALIIRWLLALGLRRGQLLGVQISDISFQSSTVEIIRRPGNPDQPRADPPLVKTRPALRALGSCSKLPEHLLLVIDEASMVDLLTAFRLVDVLPDSARMLWVGDEAQLPPVGAGLVFHALMQAGLPALRLSTVKRHAAASEIHRVANTIRNGEVPQIAPLHADLNSEVAHTTNWSLRHIAELWLRNGGAERTIILSPTKKGPGGVDEINTCLQDLMGHQRPAVHYLDHSRGCIPWIGPQGQQFHLDDRVMVTRNDYDADIRNGDLGTITDLFPAPDQHGAGAAMTIDGRRIPLTVDVLTSLSLGYAVTIHKSQGSQWPVCILMLPPHASHMTDRSLLYTAATRASERLILCGDFTLVRHGVTQISRSTGRRTNFPEHLDASTSSPRTV